MMKRMKKNSQMYDDDDDTNQHHARKSSLASLKEARKSSSSTLSDSRVPPQDMRRVKRVRFADCDSVSPLSCKRDGCSLPAKGRISPSSEDPKTSEFAFYKKLREDAGRQCHSYSRAKQDKSLKNFEANNSTGELTKRVKSKLSNSEIRSFFPTQMVTPIKLMSSHSPPGDSRKSVPLATNMEVFSKKRQKLLQWATKASLLNIEECCSNRYNLVSVLLRRLIPESSEIASSCSSTGKLRHSELNTRSHCIASPDSNTPFKEIPQTTTMESAFPATRQYAGNCLFECHSKNLRENNYSPLDNEDGDSLCTGHANKVSLQYSQRKFDNFMDDGRPIGSVESSFGGHYLDTKFQLNGYGHLLLDHVPQQPGLVISTYKHLSAYRDSPETSFGQSNKSRFKVLEEHDLNEYLLGREKHNQLLDWNDNNLKNEQDLSLSSPDTVLNLNLPLRTLFGKSLNYKFDATGLQCSSSFPIHQDPDCVLWDICSDGYPVHAVGSQIIKDRDYQALVTNNFPVNSLYSPYENLMSGHDDDWRGFFCSPYSSCRVMSNVSRETLPPSMDTLRISSAPILDSQWEGLSLINSFREHQFSTPSDCQIMKNLYGPLLIKDKTNRCLDITSLTATNTRFVGDMFNTCDFSSLGFNVSLNRELGYPLLLGECSEEDEYS